LQKRTTIGHRETSVSDQYLRTFLDLTVNDKHLNTALHFATVKILDAKSVKTMSSSGDLDG
jgi:hypothetical protein